MFMTAFILAAIVAILAFTLSLKTFVDRNKLSPFECGFSPKESARLPFSYRFFLIALIFLIFDVELVLLFPFLTSSTYFTSLVALTSMVIFLAILGLGLYYEWSMGMLQWSEFDSIFKKSFTVNEKMAAGPIKS